MHSQVNKGTWRVLSQWRPHSGWKTLLNLWLADRFPDDRQVTTNLHKIFIIPSLTSLALLGSALVLFLMAVIFQNSLIYALSFWLLGLVIIAIFFTYRNISDLTIKSIQSRACFVGEKAVFELEVSRPRKQKKSALFIGWKFEDLVEVNLHKQHRLRIKLSHNTTKRGYLRPDRLSIFSRYPIGLMITWSYAPLKMNCIVYPEPVLMGEQHIGLSLDEESQQGAEIKNGTTDFAGIRDYQAGDSPKHIHWGTFAKTGKLNTKAFVDYANRDLWLDWDSLSIQGTEGRLSHLCARVLECFNEQQTFGLKLPGKRIQPGSGDAHKLICLTALALFGEEQ